MKRLAVLVAALALAAGAVSAQVAEAPAKVFSPRDLFGLQAATDPQVRPDGGAIAYVRVSNDIMTDRARRSIWLVDPNTGTQAPLAADDNTNLSPRWSPDGTRLAYVQAGAGGVQIVVRWVGDGRTARVANLEQTPDDLAWSPDGRTLALVMLVPDPARSLGAQLSRPEGAKWADPLRVIDRMVFRADGEGMLKPGYHHVFAVSADGGQPRQLTFGRFEDGGPITFTADGKAVLFTTNRRADWERNGNERDIYQAPVDGGPITALTSRVGPDTSPAPSPDGAKIAYVGFDDARKRGYENARLYVMDRDGRNSRVLTAGLDRSVGSPVWAADGKSIYVLYDDQGLTRVARVSLDGKVEPLFTGLAGGAFDRPYTGGQFDAAKGLIAYTDGAPDRPADIAIWRAGKTQRLTDLNADLLAGKALAKVEPLAVTSSYDHKPIGAWIATPPNFDPAKKYPLILEIHGGPFSAYGPTFASDVQLYAAAGYVVVYSNPRGSTSYGDDFANQIDRNYPSHDYDDLMSVVDAAIAKGFVDPSHLYVTGGSGGGLLTAWIVGRTDRFRAAASQKPVINWASEVLTTDGYNTMADYWFGKLPWEDPQWYWKRSPLSLVGNVKTPTLVIVGDSDNRTPPSEAEQFYAALRLRGVPSALVQVPGASHGGIAARPSQSAGKAAAILAWFERYR